MNIPAIELRENLQAGSGGKILTGDRSLSNDPPPKNWSSLSESPHL